MLNVYFYYILTHERRGSPGKLKLFSLEKAESSLWKIRLKMVHFMFYIYPAVRGCLCFYVVGGSYTYELVRSMLRWD